MSSIPDPQEDHGRTFAFTSFGGVSFIIYLFMYTLIGVYIAIETSGGRPIPEVFTNAAVGNPVDDSIKSIYFVTLLLSTAIPLLFGILASGLSNGRGWAVTTILVSFLNPALVMTAVVTSPLLAVVLS